MLAAASAARDEEIVVYTVGYGRPDAPDPVDRVSVPLLEGIAGAARRTHVVPDAADLARVFREIGADVLCP